MKIKINIGNSQLEFDGRDFKEVAKDASAFSQAKKCMLCNSANISLDYRSVKAKQGQHAGQNFDYYSVKCLDCQGRAQFGQYQTGGWFLKKWEKFEPQQNKQSSPQQQSNDALDNFESPPAEDVAF